jgi:hypothetical protein
VAHDLDCPPPHSGLEVSLPAGFDAREVGSHAKFRAPSADRNTSDREKVKVPERNFALAGKRPNTILNNDMQDGP